MTKELNKPIFIISLDTELLWGYIAYPSHDVISLMKADKEKVRGCIDTLLNLFEKHNIPATWGQLSGIYFWITANVKEEYRTKRCQGSKMIGIPLILAPIYKETRSIMEGIFI